MAWKVPINKMLINITLWLHQKQSTPAIYSYHLYYPRHLLSYLHRPTVGLISSECLNKKNSLSMSDPCPSYSCCLPAHLTASSNDCGHSPLPVQYFMFNTFQDQVWDSVSVLLVFETWRGAGTATIISVSFIAPTHNWSMIPCGVISDSFAS